MEDNRILVQKARCGDALAFEALVRAHEKMVYNLALRMTGNPDDACDLTQEAFLSAWRALPSFQMGSSFSTWIYRLTTNACIDHLRREKKRKTVTLTLTDSDGEEKLRDIPDQREGPQEAVERNLRREALHRGLGRLSPEHRQVLLLRELSGLSYREIADSLEIEEGTVKSRIARARTSLREILAEDGNFF